MQYYKKYIKYKTKYLGVKYGGDIEYPRLGYNAKYITTLIDDCLSKMHTIKDNNNLTLFNCMKNEGEGHFGMTSSCGNYVYKFINNSVAIREINAHAPLFLNKEGVSKNNIIVFHGFLYTGDEKGLIDAAFEKMEKCCDDKYYRILNEELKIEKFEHHRIKEKQMPANAVSQVKPIVLSEFESDDDDDAGVLPGPGSRQTVVKYSVLIFEKADGIIRDYKFNNETFLLLIENIDKALTYCHNTLNIIHCDIKNDNVVFKKNSDARTIEFKLIDFGISVKNKNKFVKIEKLYAKIYDHPLFNIGGYMHKHYDTICFLQMLHEIYKNYTSSELYDTKLLSKICDCVFNYSTNKDLGKFIGGMVQCENDANKSDKIDDGIFKYTYNIIRRIIKDFNETTITDFE